MFNAKNLCLDRTLKLKGASIGPGESVLIDGSKNDVKDNLFVREGMIHVEGKGGRPSRQEAPANPAMGGGDEGGAE